ncbi:ABC transporter ATP-binding protein [Bacillus velezensis]
MKDFHLDVKDEELLVLVGPSGCGKSTTLRMIAGLESISEGKLYIDGDAVNDLPPKDRDIAMVFQNYALYPHMTVFDNMAFGLKLRKLPKKKSQSESGRPLIFWKSGICSSGNRRLFQAGSGSGLRSARSIVREPKVFLMDEPLSNLDAKLRVTMRAEISKLHQRLKATIVYVTHDQTEAMTMGDRIVVMNEGDIQQAASPHEIYHYPANMFVAGFIGSPSMNFIKGVIEESHGQWYFAGSSVRLPIPKEKAAVLVQKGYSGKEMTAGLRPEHLTLAGQSEHPPEAVCRAVAEVCENLGAEMYVHAVSGDNRMTIRLDGASEVKPGDAILLAVNMNRAVFFDADTENAVY